MMCLSFPLSDTLAGANLSATRQSTRVSKDDASPIWARNGSLAKFLENSVPANFGEYIFRDCPKRMLATLRAWIWRAYGGQNGFKSAVWAARKATLQGPPSLF